jgi:hypothetical protein
MIKILVTRDSWLEVGYIVDPINGQSSHAFDYLSHS